MQLPKDFYEYFTDTFIVQEFTCNEAFEGEEYPGFDHTYQCYCNNGDYNDMPPINLWLEDAGIQYNLEAENYMFLPYLNYTVPTSLCLLGLTMD